MNKTGVVLMVNAQKAAVLDSSISVINRHTANSALFGNDLLMLQRESKVNWNEYVKCSISKEALEEHYGNIPHTLSEYFDQINFKNMHKGSVYIALHPDAAFCMNLIRSSEESRLKDVLTQKNREILNLSMVAGKNQEVIDKFLSEKSRPWYVRVFRALLNR